MGFDGDSERLLLLFTVVLFTALSVSASGFEDNRHGLIVTEVQSIGRSLKQAASPTTGDNSSLLLAEGRTTRRDPLNNFHKYRGGWDIRSKHYWASVGFTGLPGFILALIWAASGILFVLSLLLYCCCCRKNTHHDGSSLLPLLLLFLLSLAAIAGCVLVYFSQAKFHSELTGTLDYVVHQSNATVENLKNVSRTLTEGSTISIFNFGIPNDEKQKIEQISVQLNSTSNQLENKTEDNAHRIKKGINNVRLAMIIVAGVMLLLVLLGILFTACGWRAIVYPLVIIGWLLVIGTWILCGVFILLNNVMGDTCVAMEEWVRNPNASTNLDDILPCVNQTTADQTLLRSKEVAVSTVSVMNRAVSLVLNNDNVPSATPFNFNQSGPTMPTLCSPYGPAPDYSENRQCQAGTITLQQAPGNWSGYVCKQEANGKCQSTGRMTQNVYNQLTKTVAVATGLSVNVPFLVNVQNCVFVRETFQTIINDRCPDLRRYTKWIYIGLALISAGAMLSIPFWILATRRKHHQRHVGYEKNDPDKFQHPHPA